MSFQIERLADSSSPWRRLWRNENPGNVFKKKMYLGLLNLLAIAKIALYVELCSTEYFVNVRRCSKALKHPISLLTVAYIQLGKGGLAFSPLRTHIWATLRIQKKAILTKSMKLICWSLAPHQSVSSAPAPRVAAAGSRWRHG